ncbi:MAG: formylglycine-generating enzyme family protein [Lentisphaeria bacterium]|nr:formylglycine-generating enzyme family protein [Lentisphaeria bacterium]
MDVNELKKRAAEHHARREEERRAKVKKRSRFSRKRWIIWFVELIVLAFAVEHFIWRPRLREKAAAEHAVDKPAARVKRAPVLGDRALKMPGVREVPGCPLPDTDALAPGAAAAQAAQLDVSAALNLPVEVENSIGMRFRLIPNGTFLMGSPESEFGRGEGEVQHVREIKQPFYMGAWEVTQAQWKAVMGADNNPSGFPGRRHPVEEVTWSDCQRFVIALCAKEGVPKWTYRLPSEQYWEYACRAGAMTAYHFGASARRLKEFDNYQGSLNGRPQACGSYPPNAYGLHDMHGNVWEWCRDIFANYPGCDLPDATNGQWRVIRGGNFHVEAADCRSAERARLPPESTGNVLGFRIIRVIPELYHPASGQPTGADSAGNTTEE